MKQINIELSNDELILLEGYFKTSPIKLIQYKSQAIIMFNSGLKFEQISQFLFRANRTIRRWMEDFSKRRISSLFCGHMNNENAGKLTKSQKLEIKLILSK